MTTIDGIVIRGSGKSRKVGCQTANIRLTKPYHYLRDGVYASISILKSKPYKTAIAVLLNKKRIQAHLIGYVGSDFYDEPIQFHLVEQISQMRHCDTLDELKAKINNDISRVEKVLESIVLERFLQTEQQSTYH